MITVKCKGDNEVIGVSMNKFKGMKEGDIIELVHVNGSSMRLVAVSDVGAPCNQCYFLTSDDDCPNTPSGNLMCSLFPRSYSLVKTEDLI